MKITDNYFFTVLTDNLNTLQGNKTQYMYTLTIFLCLQSYLQFKFTLLAVFIFFISLTL